VEKDICIVEMVQYAVGYVDFLTFTNTFWGSKNNLLDAMQMSDIKLFQYLPTFKKFKFIKLLIYVVIIDIFVRFSMTYLYYIRYNYMTHKCGMLFKAFFYFENIENCFLKFHSESVNY